MRTIANVTKERYRDKGSKFYGYLHPAQTVDDIQAMLDQVKAEHSSATHHCYAYRINPGNLQEFKQDDGEPSGSAGTPILNQLRSSELINCVAVVARYFGGTKLGISGLIDAYGKTVNGCIQKAEWQTVYRIQKIQISYPYPEQSQIEKLKSHWNLIELDAHYRENATITFGCKLELAEDFVKELKKEASFRAFTYEVIGEDIITR